MENLTQEQIDQLNTIFEPIAKTAVEAYVKEAGLDKIDQKYVVLPKEDTGMDEKEQLVKSDERFGRLTKAIWAKDYIKIGEVQSEIKAADPNNMTTDGEGGYLVPNATAAEILQLIPTYGQLRRLVDVGQFPTGTDTLNVPKAGTGMTVYYPGENAAITASKLTIDIIALTAKKATGLAVLTNELKQFGIVDFANHIKNRAAQAFGVDEDAKGFGIVNTVFPGLFYGSNSYGFHTDSVDTTAMTYDQVMGLVYGVDPNYTLNAKFIMHRSVMHAVRGIVDLQGRPIFVDANAGGVPTLLGKPVVLAEQAPDISSAPATGTPFLFYGDPKYAMIKDKVGMRIDLFNEGTVASTSLLENDLSALRFIRHWVFNPGLVEGYAVLKAV